MIEVRRIKTLFNRHNRCSVASWGVVLPIRNRIAIMFVRVAPWNINYQISQARTRSECAPMVKVNITTSACARGGWCPKGGSLRRGDCDEGRLRHTKTKKAPTKKKLHMMCKRWKDVMALSFLKGNQRCDLVPDVLCPSLELLVHSSTEIFFDTAGQLRLTFWHLLTTRWRVQIDSLNIYCHLKSLPQLIGDLALIATSGRSNEMINYAFLEISQFSEIFKVEFSSV